eukprot:5465979-Pleurochrysis_carterae.AAC.1
MAMMLKHTLAARTRSMRLTVRSAQVSNRHFGKPPCLITLAASPCISNAICLPYAHQRTA